MAIKADAEFVVPMKLKDELTEGVKKAGKSAKAAAADITSLQLAVVSLNQAWELARKVYDLVADPIRESLQAYTALEKTQTRLAATLKMTGQYSRQAMGAWESYAGQLRNVSVVDDAAVLSMISMAKVMRLSDTQAKTMIETAIDLAGATGGEVTDAFRQLQGLAAGTGRELKKLVPALRDLTDEQLSGADGMKLVADRVRGMGAAAAQSLDGLEKRYKVAVDGLREEIGGLLAEVFNIPAKLEGKIALFQNLAEEVKKAKPLILGFRDDVVAAFKGVQFALARMDWKPLLLGLAGVATAAAVATAAMVAFNVALFGQTAIIVTAVAARLWAMATSLGAAGLAATVAAGKFVLIGIAVTGVVLAIDIVVRNLGRLDKLWTATWTGMAILATKTARAAAYVMGEDKDYAKFTKNIEELGRANDEALAGLDTGIAGSIVGFIKDMTQGYDDARKAAEGAKKAVDDFAGAKAGPDIKPLSAEFRKALDEILKKTAEYRDQAALAGKDDIDQAKLKHALALREIADVEAKIRKAGELTAAVQKQLAQSRANQNAGTQATLEGLFSKRAEDQRKAAEDALQAAKMAGLSEVQLAQEKIRAKQTELDMLGIQAAMEGALTEQMRQQLAAAKQAAQETGALDIARARKKALDDMVLANRDLAIETMKIGKDQEELLKIETDLAMQAVDLAEKKAKAEGTYTAELQAQLDLRRRLIAENSQKKREEGEESFIERLKRGMKEAFQDLNQMADLFKDFMSGGAVNRIATTFEDMGSWPEKVMVAFTKLGDVLTKIIANLPTMLQNFLQRLPELMSKILDAIPKAMGAIGDMIPKLASALADALPKVLDSIMAKLPDMISKLADGLVAIIDKLPAMLESIMNRLPDIITSLLEDAFPKLLQSIMRAIPNMIKVFMDKLPDIVEALVTGIISAMGDIVVAFVDFFIGGGLEKIVKAFIHAIPRIALALVNGIINGLAKAIGKLGNIFGGGMKAPKAVTELPKKIEESVKAFSQRLGKESSQLFQVKNLENDFKKMNPLQSIQTATTDAVNQIKKAGINFMDLLKKGWKWIYDTILAPFVDFLSAVWKWVWEKVLKPATDALKAVWDFVYQFLKPVIQFLKDVWDFALKGLKPLIEMLEAVWKFINNSILKPFVQTISAAWNTVINFFKNIFAGKIGEAFKGIIDFFEKAFKINVGAAFDGIINFFNNLGNTLANAFKGAINGLGSIFEGFGGNIWDGLKKSLGSIGDFFTKAFDAINPQNLFKKIFNFDWGAKGQGTVEKILGIDIPFLSFAEGGWVPGTAKTPGDSSLNDTVHALVSPGEVVIPRSRAQDPRFAKIIDDILDGHLPKFKIGGTVGQIIDAVTGGAKSITNSVFGGVGGTVGDILRGDPEKLTDTANHIITQAAKEAQKFATNPTKYMQEMLSLQKLWAQVFSHLMDGIMDTFKANKFHSGGLVGGDAEEGVALLKRGEFVMNAESTAANLGTLKMMNASKGAVMAGQGGGGGVIIQKIEIHAKTNLDQDAIRREVVPAFLRELKRRSQDGEFVLAAAGIRR